MEDILYFGYANGHLTRIKQYAWSTAVEQKVDGEWIEVYNSIANVDVSDVRYVNFTVLAGMGGNPNAGKTISWAVRPAIQL